MCGHNSQKCSHLGPHRPLGLCGQGLVSVETPSFCLFSDPLVVARKRPGLFSGRRVKTVAEAAGSGQPRSRSLIGPARSPAGSWSVGLTRNYRNRRNSWSARMERRAHCHTREHEGDGRAVAAKAAAGARAAADADMRGHGRLRCVHASSWARISVSGLT